MEEELQCLRKETDEKLSGVTDIAGLEAFRIKYLGRKGRFNSLMKELGNVPDEDRPRLGKLANQIKKELEKEYKKKKAELEAAGFWSSAGDKGVDLTLPGRKLPFGRPHPVSTMMEEICAVFEGMGFGVAEGPDVETDFYNFEALNISAHHPARDMHDTFYFGKSTLLRTHTSPMQARIMEQQDPPLRMIAPGKVYRCDFDVTHTPMFHQVEGFLVDKKISFTDLQGVLGVFIARIFDEKTSIRARPSYFPFTEPSAEIDIGCVMCGGKGCRICEHSGWLEILGAGMIAPEVFKQVKYDPDQYSGFAFGLGVERIAMLKYGIDDIRLFYENDARFLRQF
ncbi:MAG: phenylalanine--tRNA ligase subunit alpha [Thermodesulfobacteriota bacterium]